MSTNGRDYRITRVRRGDRRVAGYYEQSAAGPDDPPDRTLAIGGATAGLCVGGMIDHAERVSFAQLRAIAAGDHLSEFDSARIRLVDLLALVHVGVDADVVVVEAIEDLTFAFRIDTALERGAVHLELGSELPDGRRDWRGPITLHGTTLPSGSSVAIRRLAFVRATDFAPDRNGSGTP